jgi:hypothetical protein
MLLGLVGGLSEVEQRLIGLQGQPGTGNFTDQTQARGLVIRLAGLEPRIGRVALTAQAPEEVELIGGETRSGLKRIVQAARTDATALGAHQGRDLAAPGVGVDADGRKQRGMRAVGFGAGLFHRGRVLTQATVVLQRQVDHLSQPRVGDEGVPVFLKRPLRISHRAFGVGRPLLIDRRVGALIGRLQRAAAEQEQGEAGEG